MSDVSVKIFISCHKDCFIPSGSLFFPVQAGSALAEKRLDMLHDDEGENISSKNRSYCELTTQYWVWKNQLSDADYVGFWHYRRYMSFSDAEYEHDPFGDVIMDYLDVNSLKALNLEPESMREKISGYDVITVRPASLRELSKRLRSNRHQYESTPYQYKEDIDVMLDIIKEKYPDYFDTALWYLNKAKYGYFCNMFIMKKELFEDYSSWLFSILDEHEKRRDYYKDYNARAYRVSGYLGERLFGIWYLHLKKTSGYRTCELQRVLFKNTEKNNGIIPAFEKNNVAVALASNNGFAPYLSVTVESIIENSSESSNYDILIITSEMSKKNKAMITRLATAHDNVRIRFVNPGKLLEGFSPHLHGHFGCVETYYRLVFGEMLPLYEKLLYLDADMVVNADVADLYSVDVSGYLLGACHDADTAGLYNGWQKGRKEYSDNILKLKSPYDYFQAGTVLFNLAEFRKIDTASLLSLAQQRKWLLQDQDILNKVCEGRVRFVDTAWNVLCDYGNVRINDIISRAPHYLSQDYHRARKNPKIIHFAGSQKPWVFPEMDFAYMFWEYARKTPLYEIIKYRSILNLKHSLRKNKLRKIKLSFTRMRADGFFYSIKKGIKHFLKKS